MLSYLLPVLAFTLGILLADTVRCLNIRLHWRQLSVLLEAVILICVAFFPHSLNPLANSLTSFVCGIQVESFRKIRNRGAATTMCIGNLRNGTENLHRFLRTHDRKAFYNALLFYGIILCFIIGAVLGNFVIKRFHEKSILVCSALLFIAFFMMFVNKEQK